MWRCLEGSGSSKKFKLELSMGNPAEFSKYSYRKGDNAEPEEVLLVTGSSIDLSGVASPKSLYSS